MIRLLDKKDKIRYAVFAAEQVIDVFEKKFPEERRPRNAIEAAKKVIERATQENRDAAYVAAYAAASVYADSATDDVIYDAVYDAVYDVVTYATDATGAKKTLQVKIIKYGISLLK